MEMQGMWNQIEKEWHTKDDLFKAVINSNSAPAINGKGKECGIELVRNNHMKERMMMKNF